MKTRRNIKLASIARPTTKTAKTNIREEETMDTEMTYKQEEIAKITKKIARLESDLLYARDAEEIEDIENLISRERAALTTYKRMRS